MHMYQRFGPNNCQKMVSDAVHSIRTQRPRAEMRRSARVLFSAGKFQAASLVAEDITTEHGDTPIDLVFLASCLRQNNNNNGAEIILRRCLEIAPDHTPARFALAQVLSQREEYDEAIAQAREALADEPASMKTAMLLGWLNRQTADLAGEQRAYGAAVAIDPTSVRAQLGLATASLGLKDNQTALNAVKATLIEEPGNQRAVGFKARLQTLRRKHIRALKAAGRTQDALTAAGQLIQDFGETAKDAVCLAECLGKTGDNETARSIMAAAAALEPENASVRLSIAKWYGEINETDQAIREAETALSLDQTSETAALLIGQLQRRTGNIQGERQAFMRAIAINPQSARALSGLAAIAQRSGDLADALAYVDAALAINPEFPPALRVRAIALASSNQPLEDQRAAFEAAIAAAPQDVLLLRTYADAMVAAGDTDSAVTILSKIETASDDPYQQTRFFARCANLLAKIDATDAATEWAKRAADSAAAFNRGHDAAQEIDLRIKQAQAAATTPPDIPFVRALLAAASGDARPDASTWALQRLHFGKLAASWSLVATQAGPDHPDPWGDVIDISELIAFQENKAPGPAMLVGGHIGPPVVLQNSFSRYAPNIHCLSSNAAFWLSREDSSGFILASVPNRAALSVFDRLRSGATVFVGADGMLGERGLHGEAFGFQTNWASGAATLARKTSAVVYGCHALWDERRIKIAITPGLPSKDVHTDDAWMEIFGRWYGDLLEGVLKTDPANYRPGSYRYFGLDA